MSEVLLYLILATHARSSCMRSFVKSSLTDAKCTRIILDLDRMDNSQLQLMDFDGDHIITTHSDFGNFASKITHYVIESDDPQGIEDLFQCERGVIFSKRFEPFTHILVLLHMDTDLKQGYDAMIESLICFSEFHAHYIQLYVDFGKDHILGTIYQGHYEEKTKQCSSEDLLSRQELKKWRPNFANESNVFRAAYFHYPPYVSIEKADKLANAGENGNYLGLDRYIITEVTRGWRVMYKYYREMAFAETVRDVLQNKVHTCLNAVWNIRVPFQEADSTISYTETCVTFVVQNPMRESVVSSGFLIESAHYSFWIMVITQWAIITGIMYVFTVLYQQLYSEGVAGGQLPHWKELFGMAFRRYGDLLLNCTRPTVVRIGLRIIHAAWLLTSLILTTAYCSGVSSRLTVPEAKAGIHTFKDALQHNLTWIHDGSDSHSIFEQSAHPYLRRLANHALTVGSYVPPERLLAITNVFYSKYVNAYIDPQSEFEKSLLQECAGLYSYVYPLNKRSSFTMIFNRKLFQLVEGGLIQYWTESLYRAHKDDEDFHIGILARASDGDVPQQKITLKPIQGLLILMAFVYVLSVLVFIIEIVYYKSGYWKWHLGTTQGAGVN